MGFIYTLPCKVNGTTPVAKIECITMSIIVVNGIGFRYFFICNWVVILAVGTMLIYAF